MVNPEKRAMRQALQSLRQTLDVPLISNTICQNILQSRLLDSCTKVLTYFPLPYEINLLSLISHYPRLEWHFPKTLKTEEGTEDLFFYPYTDDTEFKPGRFGVMEPVEYWPPLKTFEDIQLIFLPGLAYDTFGNRIGHGKGFYDRFVQRIQPEFQGKLVGVSTESTVFESLPTDPWDHKVQYLFTESTFYRF